MPFGGLWRWDGYAWQPVEGQQPQLVPPRKSRKGLLIAAVVVLALVIATGIVVGL
jgi:hypothetical protein